MGETVRAADLIFSGGPIVTMTATGAVAEALAVRDGRIVAVGTWEEVRALRGPSTREVDLAGGTLLPGLQDAHVHPVGGGLERLRCDLSELDTAQSYLSRIADYAKGTPDPWILGGGWAMSAFPGGVPGREDLDAIVPDRPVFLPNRDHHSAWVNSRALELAGADSQTPDPADGRIERDADGAPSGCLHEGAMDLVGRFLPPLTGDDIADGLREGMRYLNSLGITAYQDAIVGAYSNIPDAFEQYLQLDSRGELTARVRGALWWERQGSLAQLDALSARRDRAVPGGRFRPTSVKLMLDGVCETFTASVFEPYLDRSGASTGNRGIDFIDPDALPDIVAAIDKARFQSHFHALGDRAVHNALDALAGLPDPARGRPHLAHIQIVAPEDIPRFRAVGATGNMQPLWACHDEQMVELTRPFVRTETFAQQYPFASLADAGVWLAGGSDWPVSTPNPWEEIHVAVNRVLPGSQQWRDDDVFLPGERLSLHSALRAFTFGSSYVNGIDDETGTLETGKLADMVMVDRDLRTIPVGELSQVRTAVTLLEGEPIYDAR